MFAGNCIHTYICSMEKPLTLPLAWADFWANLKESENWNAINRIDKQYLYKADKANRDGELGLERFRRLAETYAPGRYRFEMIERIYRV